MSLQLNISNDLNALADALVQDMQQHEKDIFRPAQVITQTQGMNNWLLIKIAGRLGIATNISFSRPSDIILKVYNLLGGDNSAKLSRANIDWLVLKVLGETDFQKRFPQQTAYYKDGNDINPVRQWELAAKLADLFDQYQVYRHEKIKRWNKNGWESVEAHFQWQAYIWQRIKTIAGSAFPDMTEMQDFILAQLKHPGKIALLKAGMPTLYLFGLSIITTYHIHIIYELAQHIHFYLYLLNPAPEQYWIEDRSERDIVRYRMRNQAEAPFTEGNTLLTNWGRIIQDTFKLLYRDDLFINEQKEIEIVEPVRRSLLGKIQNDIYFNRVDDIEFVAGDLKDGSITITSNYSIQREAETLYNYLTDIISNRKISDITERDILVVVTDINKYAPYIRAVFDNAPYRFNYSIADETIATGDSIINALRMLLQLNEQNLTAENVLQLLESSHIRRHFGIDDITFVRMAVKQAGIHFGIDNNHYDDTEIVSWQYGLKKLMYGMCMAGEQELVTDGPLPFLTVDIADSMAGMQELVRFCKLAETVIDSIRQRAQARNITEWKSYLEHLLNDCIASPDNETQEAYWKLINKMNDDAITGILLQDHKVSYDVWSRRLLQSLSGEAFSARYLSRGITFCSPLPFRSIPFKVIAMLGLNFDDFPRQEKKSDFDLVKSSPRTGDRNVKNNDKHLFLELLLSARDTLYLSYIGQSVKDNSVLPPAVLIDELLDYIEKGLPEDSPADLSRTFVQQHPLHSYSKRYGADENLLPNYLIRPRKDFPLPLKLNVTPETAAQPVILLDEVKKFCTNAIAWFYNRQLGFYLDEHDESIADTEVFQMNYLDKWKIKNALLKNDLNGDSTNIIHNMYLRGKLPLKNTMQVAVDEDVALVQNVSDNFRKIAGTEQLENITATLILNDGLPVRGTVNNYSEEKIFAFLLSKNEAGNLIALYIDFLFACAAGVAHTAYFITHDEIRSSRPLAQEAALQRLHEIISFMQENTGRLVFFAPGIVNWDKKKNENKIKDETALRKYIESEIKGGRLYDDYVAHAYTLMQAQDVFENYARMTTMIYKAAMDTF